MSSPASGALRTRRLNRPPGISANGIDFRTLADGTYFVCYTNPPAEWVSLPVEKEVLNSYGTKVQ